MARRAAEEVEEVLEEGYTRVVSAFGAESVVPDTILETLLASGYTVK
jgi:hypothetical protein